MTKLRKIRRRRTTPQGSICTFRARKNPIGHVNSQDDFLRFQILSQAETLNYATVTKFSNDFINTILKNTPKIDIADLCTAIYLKGLFRGYSLIFRPTRYDAKVDFNRYLDDVNYAINEFLTLNGISPSQNVKKK